MIRIVARFKLKPGVREEYLPMAKELVRLTLQEEGCIAYALFEDLHDPDVVAVLEEWRDEAAVVSHNKSPHVLSIVPKLRPYRLESDVRLYRPLGEEGA